jgi:hypothetical protein
MSIRINKLLGYALKFKRPYGGKSRKFDPRLKMSPREFSDLLYDNEKRYTVEGALAYGKLNGLLDEFEVMLQSPAWAAKHSEKIPSLLNDHIRQIYNGDEWEGIVLMIPSEHNKWQRFDDSIDHYEYNLERNDLATTWKWLQSGIYPYLGYINLKTGQNFEEKNDIEALIKAKLKEVDIDSVLQKYGFTNLADYKANTMPVVPNVIKAMCQFSSLFAEPDGWKHLRPCIVTYWA